MWSSIKRRFTNEKSTAPAVLFLDRKASNVIQYSYHNHQKRGAVALKVRILIGVVVVAVLGAVLFSLKKPLLDEETEYQITSLYDQGREVSEDVDTDALIELLRQAKCSRVPRGGLRSHSFTDMIEISIQGGDETLRVVLVESDGTYVAYQDPDWVHVLRDGEALLSSVRELLPV